MNHSFRIIEGEIDLTDDLSEEIDFDKMKPDAERTEKLRALARARLVPVDPDIIAFFKTPEAINEALRRLMQDIQGRA